MVSAGDMSPTTASSLAHQRLRRPARAQDRLGLRRRVAGARRPRLCPRGLDAPRDRDPSRKRRAHQRCALLRRPRPSGVLDARVLERARARPPRPGRRAHPAPLDGGRQPSPAAGRGDRHLQEQLRRQGQLLRLSRELPRRQGGSFLADRARADTAPRLAPDLHRSRQDRRGGLPRRPSRRRSSSASGPTSSRRRSGSRRRSSGRSSTPATNRTPTRRSTAVCT